MFFVGRAGKIGGNVRIRLELPANGIRWGRTFCPFRKMGLLRQALTSIPGGGDSGHWPN